MTAWQDTYSFHVTETVCFVSILDLGLFSETPTLWHNGSEALPIVHTMKLYIVSEISGKNE
jgi:hypothetical protein